MKSTAVPSDQAMTRRILRSLGIPVNRNGYQMLCIAVPRFAQDPKQGITKELYPHIAAQCGCFNPQAVERAIRSIISDAWACRDPLIWEQYFPGCTRQPSNKQFIATIAERIRDKRIPPVSGRERNARRKRLCRVYYLCPALIVSRPK